MRTQEGTDDRDLFQLIWWRATGPRGKRLLGHKRAKPEMLSRMDQIAARKLAPSFPVDVNAEGAASKADTKLVVLSRFRHLLESVLCDQESAFAPTGFRELFKCRCHSQLGARCVLEWPV
mgnify:CR=1 FL=1